MSRRAELIALLVSDTLMLGLAFALQYTARFQWGWFGVPERYPVSFWPPLLLVVVFWLLLFFFFGMYRERFASSRFDEATALLKVSLVGVLVLVFAIYMDALQPGSSRAAIFFYGAAVFGCTVAGRLVVRSVQKWFILQGKGLHRALIVGWGDRVENLHRDVLRYPEAGLQVVGAIRMTRPEEQPMPVLAGLALIGSEGGDGASAHRTIPETASVAMLPRLIDDLQVQDVLIALGSEDHGPLMEVLRLCEGKPVALKLVPDFYTLIGGMARTEHIYGLPLIEVLPEPMPAWEQSTKRLLDAVSASLILAAGLPLWIAIGIAVRLSSPGPAIYRQERVGQHGRPFTMLKYRTMRQDAEHATGPVWATTNDDRYTPLGKWLRKTRLDEVPQLWNVLKGEMSLVGPRPERPFFVERLAREIPLYTRRHRVKPGITGWAQVKRPYDATVEDVRTKVKYDLFYIENMSLAMDLKILLRTIRTALSGQGR